MPAEALRVKGYREFVRAAARAEKDSKREIRAALREVAEPVRAAAAARFSVVDAHSASGYRVAVRQRGVSVVQRLTKTTGLRPDYGSLQMRKALIPALSANEAQIEHGMERAIDRIADHFER